MVFPANSQQNPLHSEKSTTMWTQPKTEEQKRYFSKHAPKRRAYGIIQTILQVVHAAIALAAWGTIFAWVLQKFPTLQWLTAPLGIGSLLTLHWLFRTTWDTFWYDRLDDDPNTDSSVWMPVAILLLLLAVEINGAQHFLINNIDKPVVVDAKPVDAEHATLLSHFDQMYETDAARIESVYKTKLAAAKKKWNSRIYAAQNESAATDAAKKARQRKVSSLISQRDAELGEIESRKADELATALQAFNDRKRTEENRRDRAVARIDSTNVAASQQYADDINDAGSYAWIISVALLWLIAGLGYARVRINVKSGILPIRNYTILDAHGSATERIATAIGDAFNRQSMKVAVAIHKSLSPAGPITSFDGTVIAKQGTYNTPHSPTLAQKNYPPAVNGLPKTPAFGASNTPTVSQCDTPQETIDADAATWSDNVLELARTRIQADLANLTNGNGNPKTVVERMGNRVGDLHRAIDTGNFIPSKKKAAQFLEFNDNQLAKHAEKIKEYGGFHNWQRIIEHLEQFVQEPVK